MPETPQDAEPPAKQAVNMRIDAALVRRLKLHSLETNRSLSDIVAEMIEANVPEYSVTQK